MSGDLRGNNLIAGSPSRLGEPVIYGRDPETGERLMPAFFEAVEKEISAAATGCEEAFEHMRVRPAEDRAALLDAVAFEIEGLGEDLVDRVRQETGLGRERIRGERGRTTNQLRMFAALIREGSWVDARIDLARPERSPLPKPDIRRMLVGIGPVAVFGASNFPLAFSVAGGDTASALAAGCPVVVKAHPAHPGTSELVGEAVNRAVASQGFHAGTFSLVHGVRPEVSLSLVRHPAIRAVGFTGSLRAGRALFDAAAARPEPIPVFAEMGSVNPVFVLPGALKSPTDDLAKGLAASVTLGAGQFCTNPGVVFGISGPGLDTLRNRTAEAIGLTAACTLLHEGIRTAYEAGLQELEKTGVVSVVSRAPAEGSTATPAAATTLAASGSDFLRHKRLQQEVFGPSTLFVSCRSKAEMESVARGLEGNLTASIHGTADDLEEYADLVRLLENKVGRLIFNGYPTGVEVCASMHHGGPYPATTDARSTSVGTAAVYRFARPVCYQNFPEATLPPELRNRNERGIWRLVDNELTKDDIAL